MFLCQCILNLRANIIKFKHKCPRTHKDFMLNFHMQMKVKQCHIRECAAMTSERIAPMMIFSVTPQHGVCYCFYAAELQTKLTVIKKGIMIPFLNSIIYLPLLTQIVLHIKRTDH